MSGIRYAAGRKRVVFITIVPSPYQRDLFRALAARDEVELSVYYMEKRSPDSPWPEVPLQPYETVMPGFWLPLAGRRVHANWRYPDLSHADVIVIGSYVSFTAQWLMRTALEGKPWLFWGERLRAHKGMRHEAQNMLISPLNRAAAIVGIGRVAEEDYRRRFPEKPHFSIPYHCELADFQSIKRIEQSEKPFTFLFCGQMIYRKGIDLLLEAFKNLVVDGLDVKLILVGREADLPHVLNSVDSVALARVDYAGFQPPSALPALFAKADAFVLPSRHDGWGVVINQALGAGLPVISSDAVGAALDFVEDGVNGFMVKAGDADSLGDAMGQLAINPDMARCFGTASLARSARLTPEAGAARWVDVFESLSAGFP